jgi:hypothetical protein
VVILSMLGNLGIIEPLLQSREYEKDNFKAFSERNYPRRDIYLFQQEFHTRQERTLDGNV